MFLTDNWLFYASVQVYVYFTMEAVFAKHISLQVELKRICFSNINRYVFQEHFPRRISK